PNHAKTREQQHLHFCAPLLNEAEAAVVGSGESPRVCGCFQGVSYASRRPYVGSVGVCCLRAFRRSTMGRLHERMAEDLRLSPSTGSNYFSTVGSSPLSTCVLRRN